MRPQVTRTTPWPSPRDHGVKTNVEPLLGRAKVRSVIAIYGGLSLLIWIVFLILLKFLVPG